MEQVAISLERRRSGSRLRVGIIGLLLTGSVIAGPARSVTQEMTWTAYGGGNWNVATNWSPNQVPDAAGEAALIPAGTGTYSVTVNLAPTIDWLRAENPGTRLIVPGRLITLLDPTGLVNHGTIEINATSGISGNITNLPLGTVLVPYNAELYLLGPSIANDGLIQVNQAAMNNARIRLDQPVFLSGAGTILMNGDDEGDEIYTNVAAAMTQGAGHTIHGRGRIRCPLINEGTVLADNGTLWINSTPSITNRSLLAATNGATLEIKGVTVENLGGRIFADGGAVNLRDGARVNAGTLERSGSSVVMGNGTIYLRDVTIPAGSWLDVNYNGTAVVDGSTVMNDGTIRVNQAAGWDAKIQLNAPILLTGAGEILLNGDNEGDEIYTNIGAMLTQAAGHTIRGRGRIRCPLTNEGFVIADNGFLWINSTPSITNRSLLRAANGATLEIRGVAVDNAGGRIFADGGTVNLRDGTRVAGGTLESFGTSVVMGNGTVYLTNVTIPAGSWYDVNYNGTTILDGSTLTNGGTIRVNQGAAWDAKIRIDAPTLLSGGGEIVLYGDDQGDEIFTTVGATLTQAAGNTIRGRGRIRCPLVNEGIVIADNGTLWMNGMSSITNRTLMRTANGATLEISGVAVDNAGGRLLADSGAVHLRDGARVIGGTLERSGTSIVMGSGTVYFENVTIGTGGWYDVNYNGATILDGRTLTNNGTIRVNQSAAWDAKIRLDHPVSLSGPGVLILNGDNDSDEIYTDVDSTLTQQAEHTIQGRGRIRCPFTNYGTVQSAVPAGWLRIETLRFRNEGLVEASGGGEIRCASLPLNYSGGTLTGGRWDVLAGSRLRLIGADITTNAAAIVLDGAGSVILKDWGSADALANLHTIAATGSFTIRGGRSFTPTGDFTNLGRVTIGAGSAFTPTGSFVQSGGGTYVESGGVLAADTVLVRGGKLAGLGTVNGPVRVDAGVVAPGLSCGHLTVNGTYAPTASGTLEIEIGGAAEGQYDHLCVSGQATLGGTLSVRNVEGFEAGPGQQYEILTCASRSGEFTPGLRQFVGPGIYVEPVYTDTSVVLVTREVPAAGIDDPGAAASIPEAIRFFAAHSATAAPTLCLDLPTAAEVTIRVFDAAGRVVAVLDEGTTGSGRHTFGRERIANRGGSLPAGVYFARARVAASGGVWIGGARFVVIR